MDDAGAPARQKSSAWSDLRKATTDLTRTKGRLRRAIDENAKVHEQSIQGGFHGSTHTISIRVGQRDCAAPVRNLALGFKLLVGRRSAALGYSVGPKGRRDDGWMIEHDERAYDPDLDDPDNAISLLGSDPLPTWTAEHAVHHDHHTARHLTWIQVAEPGVPYFVTETGASWTPVGTPVGQNDAISWDELAGLFRRRNLAAVEAHLRYLAEHGVTCLRLMLEYAQVRHRYIERPVGRFVPAMVRLWDDLFALCEKVGLRILLTPFDTFWMWLHWRHHPYNQQNGGQLAHPSRFLLDEAVRAAIKDRLTFAVERWGGSGALFAWDLWNEIHPAHGEEHADGFAPFIADLSQHVRGLEMKLYGRSHLQTVLLFGPELLWRPHLPMAEPIFRHPDLDFASIHIYASGTDRRSAQHRRPGARHGTDRSREPGADP